MDKPAILKVRYTAHSHLDVVLDFKNETTTYAGFSIGFETPSFAEKLFYIDKEQTQLNEQGARILFETLAAGFLSACRITVGPEPEFIGAQLYAFKESVTRMMELEVKSSNHKKQNFDRFGNPEAANN